MSQLGLNNNSTYSGNKIKLVDGAFRIPSSQGVQGAEMRKAMNPRTKETKELWEIPYKNLTAYIKNIAVDKSDEYGDKVNITLEADKTYTLSFNPDSNYLLGIFKRLPNVDPALPVDFTATLQPGDDGKMQTSLFMAQQGTNLKWAHTTANPNGMPLATLKKFNGKEVNDKTEQIEFLWDKVVNPFLVKVKETAIKKEITDEDEIMTNGLSADDFGEINPADIPF